MKRLKAAFFPKTIFSGFSFSNMNQNHAAWLNADMESFAKKGYSENVYVYAAVTQIARRCGSIPWVLYRVSDEQKFRQYRALVKSGRKPTRRMKEEVFERDDAHPIAEVLKRPNILQTWSEFVESVESFKLIMGNSFVWGPPLLTGENAGKFTQIFPYRADRVTVRALEYPNPITSYKLDQKEVPPEQVMHLRFFNPLDPRIGMSPIEAALRPVTQSNEYLEWNTSLVQNGGQSPGIIGVKKESITQQDVENVKEKFRRTQTGQPDEGLPVVTEAEMLTWIATAVNPKDMDWVHGLEVSGKLIAVAFDIPEQLIGGDTKYENADPLIRYFYKSRIIPEMDALRDGLNGWLVKSWEGEEGKYFLDYSLEEIEVLQEERASLHLRARENYRAGLITLNEARESIGEDAVEGPDGDQRLIPLGASFSGDENLDDVIDEAEKILKEAEV